MSTATLDSSAARVRPRQRRTDLGHAAERVLLGALPLVVIAGMIAFQYRIHAVAVDFHSAYYPAASRLLDGADPYAVTHRALVGARAFVYPALSAVMLAPFALLGRGLAQVVFMVLCIGCIPAVLWLLRVRDWRVYGMSLLWLPVYGAWQTANLTLPLVLLIALAWRHRERPWVAGLLAAGAISLKPFVWPLGLWFLATRRWGAAGWTLAWGLGLNLLSWGLVGFGRIGEYLRLSGLDTRYLWRGGYSLLAAAHHLGVGRTAGEAALVLASLVLVLVIMRSGRRGREREALTLSIVLMLVASPLVWSHYFALLLVPFALLRPRLTPLWGLPVLMWVCPASNGVAGWQWLVAWTVTGVCVTALLRASTDRRDQPDGAGPA